MIHSMEQSLEFVHWFEILIEANEHSASLIRSSSSSSRQNSLPTSELAFGLVFETAPDVDLLCVHPIILFFLQHEIVCSLTNINK